MKAIARLFAALSLLSIVAPGSVSAGELTFAELTIDLEPARVRHRVSSAGIAQCHRRSDRLSPNSGGDPGTTWKCYKWGETGGPMPEGKRKEIRCHRS